MTIEFSYLCDYEIINENTYKNWLLNIVEIENKQLGELNFVFCTDQYLIDINKKYLNHDTYTDIITFDYCDGDIVNGDVFISVERVEENAVIFEVNFNNELHRVMSHGVLHLCGYGDKSSDEINVMRQKEEEMIKLFHVEH